jgi:hypothetical protein
MLRIIIGAVVLLLLAGVAGYFLMRGEEFEIRLTQQEIQERLDQKFPLTKKYLFSSTSPTRTQGSRWFQATIE